MAGEVPTFVRAHEAISELSGLSMAERTVLLAAVRWVNFRTGQLWPSVKEWAKAAGITDRGLHGIIRKLGERGVLHTVTPSKGGRGQTSIYRIPALAVDANPERGAGVSATETPNASAETPNHEGGKPARNPERESRNPERHDGNPERGARNPEQLVRTNSPKELSKEPSRELSLARASEKPTAAARFLADRTERTGQAPPGFNAFLAEYPQGRALDRGGLLALWTAQGLESESASILGGLRAWKASEAFRDGFAPKARKFLEERHWESKPPEPKPVAAPRYGGGAF
jgi:hypothetical protein